MVFSSGAVCARTSPGLAHQCLQHALDHLDDVGLALAEVAVLDAFELRDQCIHLQLERPFGVATLGLDQILGCLGQGRVVEDHQMQVQEGRELGRSAWRNMLVQAGEFSCGL